MSATKPRNSILTRPIQFPSTRFAFVEWCCWPVIVCFACTLGLDWLGSFYTRLMGDDYYFQVFMRRGGFWGSWVTWYFTWYGRWFSQIVMNSVYSFGDFSVIFVPTLLLSIWALSLGSTIYTLTGWPIRFILRVLVLVFGLVLLSLPQLVESVYWSASSIFHTLPLTLCAFIIPIIWGNNPSPWRLSLAVFFGLCLSGCSEAFTIVWVPLLGIVALWRRDRFSVGAFVGSLVGALVMLFSPGNAVRAGGSSVRWGIPELLARSWEYGNFALIPYDRTVLYLALLVAFVWGMRHGTGKFQPKWWYPVVLVLGSYCIAILTQMPSLYGTGHIAVLRVMVIPIYLMYSAFIATSWIIGACFQLHDSELIQKKKAFTIAGVLFLCCQLLWCPYYLRRSFGNINEMRRFASRWTVRERYIRTEVAAGKQRIVVGRIGGDYTADVTSDPKNYTNDLMAKHYSPDSKVEIIGQ